MNIDHMGLYQEIFELSQTSIDFKDWETFNINVQADIGQIETECLFFEKSGQKHGFFVPVRVRIILQQIWNEMGNDKGAFWNICDLEFSRDGNFSVDFDYDTIPVWD